MGATGRQSKKSHFKKEHNIKCTPCVQCNQNWNIENNIAIIKLCYLEFEFGDFLVLSPNWLRLEKNVSI